MISQTLTNKTESGLIIRETTRNVAARADVTRLCKHWPAGGGTASLIGAHSRAPRSASAPCLFFKSKYKL